MDNWGRGRDLYLRAEAAWRYKGPGVPALETVKGHPPWRNMSPGKATGLGSQGYSFLLFETGSHCIALASSLLAFVSSSAGIRGIYHHTQPEGCSFYGGREGSHREIWTQE